MIEHEIVVPEGMLDKVDNDYGYSGISRETMEKILLHGLLWLAENPIVPSMEVANELWKRAHNLSVPTETGHAGADMLMEWQRRMFLAPEPEAVDAIKDLLFDWDYRPTITRGINDRIIEAYARGRKVSAK